MTFFAGGATLHGRTQGDLVSRRGGQGHTAQRRGTDAAGGGRGAIPGTAARG